MANSTIRPMVAGSNSNWATVVCRRHSEFYFPVHVLSGRDWRKFHQWGHTWFPLPTEYYAGDHIKKNEIREARGTSGEVREGFGGETWRNKTTRDS